MSEYVIKFHKQTEGVRGNLKCPLNKYRRMTNPKILNCDCEKLRNEMGLAKFCRIETECPVRTRLFPKWYEKNKNK